MFVLGPTLDHFASMAVRIARKVIPWAFSAITSRVTPVQMSQPNDIVSRRTRPSGRTSRT